MLLFVYWDLDILISYLQKLVNFCITEITVFFRKLKKYFSSNTLMQNFWKRLLLSWKFLVIMPYNGEQSIYLPLHHVYIFIT